MKKTEKQIFAESFLLGQLYGNHNTIANMADDSWTVSFAEAVRAMQPNGRLYGRLPT